MSDYPEFRNILEGPLKENGIQIPSRPGSAYDRPVSEGSQR